jgi:hypothetical protein
LSKLCIELNKQSDRGYLKKVARDLWDLMVDIYSDGIILMKPQHHQSRPDTPPLHSSSSKSALLPTPPSHSIDSSHQHQQLTSPPKSAQQQQQQATRDLQLLHTIRQHLCSLITCIKNKQIKNVFVSLLTSIYNVADVQANHEIKSDLKYLWPTQIATTNSFNLASFHDLLNTFMYDTVNQSAPFNSSWQRAMGDLQFVKNLNSDSVKYYLKHFLIETRDFFKNKLLNEQKADEKIYKFMIKSFVNLNKHTQAALMCQLLSNSNDYSAAFRYLQDSNVVHPTMDQMDQMYDCVWDMALLEYLTNLNAIRGYLEKKNALVKLIAMHNINPSNPNEVYSKTVECKKARLFQRLVDYYFCQLNYFLLLLQIDNLNEVEGVVGDGGAKKAPLTKSEKIKQKFLQFLSQIDTKNGVYVDKLQNSNVNDLPKQYQVLRSDKAYDKLDSKQYEELINLRFNSFRNLSTKKYHKLKTNLDLLSSRSSKAITHLGYEVLGFLSREILKELIEMVLRTVEEKKKNCSSNFARDNPHNRRYEITAEEIFETCRKYTYDLNDSNDVDRVFLVSKAENCNFKKKKSSFF